MSQIHNTRVKGNTTIMQLISGSASEEAHHAASASASSAAHSLTNTQCYEISTQLIHTSPAVTVYTSGSDWAAVLFTHISHVTIYHAMIYCDTNL